MRDEFTKDDYKQYLKDFEKTHFHTHPPEYKRKTGFYKIQKSAYEDGDALESN